MKNKIVVLGKNYSTPLGVIRSLGSAGYKVNMLYISKKVNEASILKASKYLSKIVIVDEENDEKVLRALTQEFAKEAEPIILFPTDDYSASFIDRFHEKLQDRYLFPHTIDKSVTEWMDKSTQSELAREIGFPTAKEWIVSLNEDDITIPKQIQYPCFLKPLVSAKGGKVGITKCSNKDELYENLLFMQRRDRNRSVMIQEFLSIVREYTIGGVCKDQEVYIPAIISKERIAQHNRGVTLVGKLVENEKLGKYFELVQNYLRRVRYIGMFDFEVLETDKGFYFGELNLRCGGPSYAYYLGGVNLPQMAVMAIGELEIDDIKAKIELNQLFLNNKVAWEDYVYGFISHKQLNRMLKDIPNKLLRDPSDSEPEDEFLRIMPKQYKTQKRRLAIQRGIKSVMPQALIKHIRTIKRSKK